MKRLIIFVMALVSSVTWSGKVISVSADEIQKLSIDQCNKIEEYVEQERKKSNIPGIAVGIVHGNEIIYTQGFGVADRKDTPVTPDTPFYIGSIGKTFTALAIRQLEGEGKLASKAPVTEYIPWFCLANGTGEQITVEDLLGHTSGLSMVSGNEAFYYSNKLTIEETVRAINRREKINRPVGESYEYSNLNYVILGLIVEYVSGMSYEEYIQLNIFEPIGMERSYVSKKMALEAGLSEGYRELYGLNVPIDCPYPTGQIPAGYQLCSVTDMAKYMIYFLNNGYRDGSSILPGNQLKPVEDALNSFKNGTYYYGLDWGITDDPALHDYNRFYGFLGATSNFYSAMLLSQVHRYGIIVLVNQRGNYRKPELMAQVIGNGISDILLYGMVRNPVERTYNTKVLMTPIMVLLITVLTIISCLRFYKKITGKKRRIALLSMVITNIVIPALTLIGVPIYYGIGWEYFLNNGIDSGLPAFTVCLMLLIAGIAKLIMLIKRVKETPRITKIKY